jgi:ABC-2 type transport system ATP-binding protein
VQKQQGLNDVFAALTVSQLHVLSMRNKANRLEELFVKLVAGEKQ